MKILQWLNDTNVGGTSDTVDIICRYSENNFVIGTKKLGTMAEEFIKHSPVYAVEDIEDLENLVDKENIDLVQINCGGNELLDIHNWCNDLNIKYIDCIHNAGVSISQAVGVIGISPMIQNYQTKKIDIITTPIEWKKFSKSKGGTIGRLGRVEEGKGCFDWVEVVRRLYKQNSNLKFSHAGTGSEIEKVEQLLKDIPVNFWGEIRNLSDYYGQLNVFLYPTTDETLCLGILQAFAARVPVVTYELEATELYKDYCMRTEVLDFNKLVYYTLNPQVDVEAAYEYVKKNHDPIIQIKKYDEVYKKF